MYRGVGAQGHMLFAWCWAEALIIPSEGEHRHSRTSSESGHQEYHRILDLERALRSFGLITSLYRLVN